MNVCTHSLWVGGRRGGGGTGGWSDEFMYMLADGGGQKGGEAA